MAYITTKEESKKKIDVITKSCRPFFNKILKDLASKNTENANIICDYIIVEQTEFNIKDSTKIGKIKALVYLSRFFDDNKSFKEMTKKDILDHLNSFRKHNQNDAAGNNNNDNNNDNESWIGTYNFRQMIFNKFFCWLYNPDEPDPTKREKPDCMKGIKKLPRKQKTSYNSGHIWDQRENAIFLKYCPLTRDRCYHAMSMDTSARPHELLGLRIKDLEFKVSEDGKQFAMVRIKNGKTGPRTVPLIDSLPYVKEWIQHDHPYGSNPDSWLFVSTGNNYGSKLTYEGLVNRYEYYKNKYFPSLLLSLLKSSDKEDNKKIPDADKSIIKNLLTKPFNPYILRHSSLTEKSTILTEAVLRSHAGWTSDSSMPRVYIHLNDESSKILLEKKGILTKQDRENSVINKSKICTNCSEPNRPDAKWCISCKMVISYDSYSETLEKQKKKENDIQEMKNQIQIIMSTLNQLSINQKDIKDKLAKDLIDKGMYVSK
ncbi:MAG: tyrosine-type recombinase/integrase [Nitrososphaeraceae archaeon]